MRRFTARKPKSPTAWVHLPGSGGTWSTNGNPQTISAGVVTSFILVQATSLNQGSLHPTAATVVRIRGNLKFFNEAEVDVTAVATQRAEIALGIIVVSAQAGTITAINPNGVEDADRSWLWLKNFTMGVKVLQTALGVPFFQTDINTWCRDIPVDIKVKRRLHPNDVLVLFAYLNSSSPLEELFIVPQLRSLIMKVA